MHVKPSGHRLNENTEIQKQQLNDRPLLPPQHQHSIWDDTYGHRCHKNEPDKKSGLVGFKLSFAVYVYTCVTSSLFREGDCYDLLKYFLTV